MLRYVGSHKVGAKSESQSNLYQESLATFDIAISKNSWNLKMGAKKEKPRNDLSFLERCDPVPNAAEASWESKESFLQIPSALVQGGLSYTPALSSGPVLQDSLCRISNLTGKASSNLVEPWAGLGRWSSVTPPFRSLSLHSADSASQAHNMLVLAPPPTVTGHPVPSRWPGLPWSQNLLSTFPSRSTATHQCLKTK